MVFTFIFHLGGSSSRQLILTEGEFKCLSLFESGYTAIGLTGLYTYTNQNGIAKLLPEIQTAFDPRARKRSISSAIATPQPIWISADPLIS